MSELKIVNNARKYVRGQVTAHHNRRDTFVSLEEKDRLALIVKLKNFKNKLDDYDTKYQNLKFVDVDDETSMNSEFALCDEYDNKIADCLGILECKSHANSDETARSLLRSPVAPLPSFYGQEDEDVTKFFTHFEDTLTKFKYTASDKFLLLKQQIHGRALILLESLEANNRSYEEAKKLLNKAFASTSVSIFNVIKQISEMKLDYSDEPFEYISKIRTLCESVKSLNISTDHFLQYFFWNGFNETFKRHFVHITNKSKPSLDEIQNHFFEAYERYSSGQKISKDGKKSVKQVSSFASKVESPNRNVRQYSLRNCILCARSVDFPSKHPIARCYAYPSPYDKFSKLKSLGACLKCSNITHSTENCNFDFRRNCFHCNGIHCSFICPKFGQESKVSEEKGGKATQESKNSEVKGGKSAQGSKSSEDSKNKSGARSKEKVSNNTLIMVETHQSTESDVILPTFSCKLKGTTIHVFRDVGCQPCFINESLATKNQLKIVRSNVEIEVGGFNTVKKYTSRVVEVPLSIGDRTYFVEAYTVPKIRFRLVLPGLSEIAQTFVDKGYNLADEYLLHCNDVIEDIDFTLGSRSSHCLLTTDVAYGNNSTSVYADSCIGILLMGEINTIKKDLLHLPRSSVGPMDIVLPSVTHDGTDSLPLTDSFDISNLNMSSYGTFSDEKYFLLSDFGNLDDSELCIATNEILKQATPQFMYDSSNNSEVMSETDQNLVKYALQSIKRGEDGRLVMPIFWNEKNCHLLGSNRKLAEAILRSNFRKLKKNEQYLELVDTTFKEQESLGIIERVNDLDQYLTDHPSHSFLAHMAVFRPQRETTKCRVVFLSNLCGSDSNKPLTLSHNQVIHAGPNLNQRLSSSLMHLRFGTKLLVFDIKRAFNQISLSDDDQSKLLFLWYRNVSKGDFTIVGFKNARLPFGLRCSPCILLLALFHILIDSQNQNESKDLKDLKQLIYQLMYMDNGGIVADNSELLMWGFQQLSNIFSPFKFELQQYVSNDRNLQEYIDSEFNIETPRKVKLLGLQWDTHDDTLSTDKIELDIDAKTKRQVMSTIASHFDILNINGPILNRSRVFSHKLQCDRLLDWDTELSSELLKEWHNIATQINSAPLNSIPRFCGDRNDTYKLLAFTDASKSMYGVVVYAESLQTGNRNFLMSRSRMVNKTLEDKTIPSLEIHAISLGAEVLIDIYNDLAGKDCVKPLNVAELQVYTDSLVCLHWLNDSSNKFSKLQKRSVFVINRLNHISKLCETHVISFAYIAGIDNPADCTTRCVSPKLLKKTNYFCGPNLYDSSQCSMENLFVVTIPHPDVACLPLTGDVTTNAYGAQARLDSILDFGRYSSLHKLLAVVRNIFFFFYKLKSKVGSTDTQPDLHDLAIKECIRQEQEIHFVELFQYFSSPSGRLKDIPAMINKHNIYKDQDGILRVKGKIFRNNTKFPILLPKDGMLTNLVVKDLHEKFNHAGCYHILSELRKSFFIPHIFSTVKRILKQCMQCKRFNSRSVKLNQNSYREFRMNPAQVPFAYMYIDYLGPLMVYQNGSKVKKWLLCLTCVWSRSVNLKVCDSLSVEDFMRAFQLHIFEHGVPQFCMSDLGSQITAAANRISDFLNNPETQTYFSKNGIKPLQFDHYFKGHSQLGALVEVCVKNVKRLLYGAIKKNILPERDFEFLICQIIHIINRRPIAFKEMLRDNTGNVLPDPITPEILMRGHSLVSFNVIPELQSEPELDPSWGQVNYIRDTYFKLRKVRENLNKIYHEEFLFNLMMQSVDKQGRYQPTTHKEIRKGDVVLLKEDFTKPHNYPLALVIDTVVNDLGEVTAAVLRKGGSRETVKRHSSKLIPLLSSDHEPALDTNTGEREDNIYDFRTDHPRQAAMRGGSKTREILDDE